MLTKIKNIFKDKRLLKSQIWITKEEFDILQPTFELVDKEEDIKRRKWKKRSYWWRNSKLKNWEQRLFFILYYFKVYPTYDEASVAWWVSKSVISWWICRYFLVLKESLKRLGTLPAETKEEFVKRFWDNGGKKYIFIDWSEREVSRSTNYSKQKKFYSWKKRNIQ